MSLITDIAPSPRGDGRVSIQVDGRPFATVSADAAQRMALRTGAPLRERDAGALRVEEERLRTLDRALDLLAVRARSARELRRRLIQKGGSAPVVEGVIERLTAGGLLDDADYARQFSRSKLAGPGLSKRRLRQELFKRGVAQETADAAIQEVLQDESIDETAMIARVARKKLRTLQTLDAASRRRRLYAFLARRGYESDDILRTINALLDDASGDD